MNASRICIGAAVLYCLSGALMCIIRGELPEGMHLAKQEIGKWHYGDPIIELHECENDTFLTMTFDKYHYDTVRENTLWAPNRTAATRALDSLDSVWLERARRDSFDKRRKRK